MKTILLFFVVTGVFFLNITFSSTSVAAELEAIDSDCNLKDSYKQAAGKLGSVRSYIYGAELREIPGNEGHAGTSWYLGNISLHNDATVIKAAAEAFNCTVTLYQKTDDGFVAFVSEDGSKNAGANKQILKGDNLSCKYDVNNEILTNTLTFKSETLAGVVTIIAYEPIIINGEIKGVLAVGFRL